MRTLVVLRSLYYIHTYIIGHYNPPNRIIDLVSHTTYVVCVNFIHKCRDLLFKVYSVSVSYSVWPGSRTLAFRLNKPTHYLLDHGDFISLLHFITITLLRKSGLPFSHCISFVKNRKWPKVLGNNGIFLLFFFINVIQYANTFVTLFILCKLLLLFLLL